jgi:DNA methylase
MFSRSCRGELLWRLPRTLCVRRSPEFSISPESASARLTRFVSRTPNEPILYGWPEGAHHFWCGARDQGDVWFVNKPARNAVHPTMKPVELVERAVRNSSKSRDIVLDPFGGSGTTLIACEKTGRSARLIELDGRYYDVAIERWQDSTGKAALLSSTSQSFADVKATRAGEAV